MEESDGKSTLPVVNYPPEIRGNLRHMLQIKDGFILAFNTVEEYRQNLYDCQRSFSRGLAVYNLTVGLDSIKQLRMEIENVERRVEAKVTRNRVLRHFMKKQVLTDSSPKNYQEIRATGVLNTLSIPECKAKRKNGVIVQCDGAASLVPPNGAIEAAIHGGLEAPIHDVNIDNFHVPPEVDLSMATTKSGQALLPVVEFYRGFYFLQMHFQLTMCLTANYTMPFITQPMSLGKRVRGWAKEPPTNSTSGTTQDRLKDIQSELVSLLNRLNECLDLVSKKMMQDKLIEAYYRKYTAAQEQTRKRLLRCIQEQRRYADTLDNMNDRLTGLATKIDLGFPKISKFYEFTGSEGIYELVDSVSEEPVQDIISIDETKQSSSNCSSGFSPDGLLLRQKYSSSTEGSLHESLRPSQRIKGESKSATVAPPVSDSVNQLLLGSEPVAPGVGPPRLSQATIPAGSIQTEYADYLVASEKEPKENKQYAAVEKSVEPLKENAEKSIIQGKVEPPPSSPPDFKTEDVPLPSPPPPIGENSSLTTPSPVKSNSVVEKERAIEELPLLLPPPEEDSDLNTEIKEEPKPEKTQEVTLENGEDANIEIDHATNSNISENQNQYTTIMRAPITIQNTLKVMPNAKRKPRLLSTSRIPSQSSKDAIPRLYTSILPQQQEDKSPSKQRSSRGGGSHSVAEIDRVVNDIDSQNPSFSDPGEQPEYQKFTLPDINDNNSLIFGYQSKEFGCNKFNEEQKQLLAKKRDNFIKESREDSWTSESEEFSYQQSIPSVSEVPCIPHWARERLRKQPNRILTEDELRTEKSCRWTSKSALEKRQVLIEGILKADGERLEDIFTALVQR